MEKKLVKLIGKLLLLCAVLTFSIGSAKAYAEEKVQTGFELIDENNDSITEPIDFILEDSEGVKQEYQSMFGYLILDVFENKVYTISIKDGNGYTMSDIRFSFNGEDPVDPDTGRSVGKLILKEANTGDESGGDDSGKTAKEQVLDSITIVTYKDDVILGNSNFRLFRIDGGIPNMIMNGHTDNEGKYTFSDLEPNREYTVYMSTPGLKFDKDNVTFVTNGSAKVIKINSKPIENQGEGLVEFKGYSNSSDKLNTTEFEFYVFDAKTNKPMPGVELTANTIVPRLSSYKNVTSDENGLVKFKLEGQEGGKTYVVCVSKNAQFMWKFEPDQITIHVHEDGEVVVENDEYPVFNVTKEDRRYLRDDLEKRIADAKKYIADNKFSSEDEVKNFERVIAAAREELDKPETIPFYVEGFINSIDEAKNKLEKYEVKEDVKEESGEATEGTKEESGEVTEGTKVESSEVKENAKEVESESKKENSSSSSGSLSTGSSYSGSSSSGGGSSKTIKVSSASKKLKKDSGKWILDSKGWWYKRADGTYPKAEWMQDKGKWYYFDNEGYMKKGWILWNAKWYYLGENGDMLLDTITPDGYRLDKDGVYIA
jgi:putative cell wall binding repeat 2